MSELKRWRLQTLARMFTKVDDLTVVLSNRASTDFKKIFVKKLTDSIVPGIPALPEECWLAMKAQNIHESGHIRFTDINAWKSACEKGVLIQHIVNIIEDSRIEKCMAAVFPGTAMQLRFQNEYIFKNRKNWGTGIEAVLNGMCTYAVCGDIPDSIQDQDNVMEVIYELISLVDIGREANDTWEVLELADQAAEIIKKHFPEPPSLPEPSMTGTDKAKKKPKMMGKDPRKTPKIRPPEREPKKRSKEPTEKLKEKPSKTPAKEDTSESVIPEKSPKESPEESLGETAKKTLEKAPEETLEDAPGDTSGKAPRETPEKAPEEAPEEVMEETPEDTSEDTPEKAPEKSLEETPKETTDETLKETAEETTDKIPESASEETEPSVEPKDESWDDDLWEDIPKDVSDSMPEPGETEELPEDDFPGEFPDDVDFPGEPDKPFDEPSGFGGEFSDDSPESSEGEGGSPGGRLTSLPETAEERDEDVDFSELLESSKEELEFYERAETEKESETVIDIDFSKIETVLAKGINRDVRLRVDSLPGDTVRYSQLVKEINPLIIRTVDEIRKALEYKNHFIARNLKKGAVDPSALWKLGVADAKVFRKKNNPSDDPTLAIKVLVDCSGSMSGTRVRTARKTAVLLHEVLTQLKINHSITGFTAFTGHDIVIHHNYVNFGEKDGTKLVNIKAEVQNRDGYSIRVATQELQAVSELKKIIMVLSDGEPWHGYTKYVGEEGYKDTALAVREAEKQGIGVIGFYFGPDSSLPTVQKIYNNLINVEQLENLPIIIGRMLKKVIAG
ncbi:Nitric oxide reductase activation protein [Desulforamulus putei DSM 12395]|uniref:Nitric oxide reductase activation protein n=1 Tax=Desulforamulus putei DSM 12395 TaxID=1121429 RepID=A0A1M4ZCN4_9FIRM|nr:hypothetical protein [Desulforamulus putei]SHF15725.1 Nitric oxide reductase activation protein [Desulforamulus putei DSM 12395]